MLLRPLTMLGHLQSMSCFIAKGQIHRSSHFIPPQGENCDLNYLVDIL